MGERMTGRRRYVVVKGKSTALRFALPELGSLSVGEGAQNDIRVVEPGVETEHATIFLDHGIGVRILDGDTVDLELGGAVRIGQAELFFTSTEEVEPAIRAVTERFFEESLAKLALEDDRPALAVVRLAVKGQLTPGTIEAVLAETLRGSDLCASLDGGELAILLTEVTESQARALVKNLAAKLSEKGAELLVGVALGNDADPEKLLEIAEKRMKRPTLGSETRIYVSKDPEMLKVSKLVDRIAPSAACVLILGETGVGKDLIAQMIHDRSARAQRPFLRVNCVDLSDAFLEEASTKLFARAKGGTIHLDEVGGLSPRAQLALGYLLEAAPTSGHDVRFLASTNQDLTSLVNKGAFRKDLLFRLNQVTINVPSLRERAADIVPLAEIFIDEIAQSAGRETKPRLTPAAEEKLSSYAWPGNVRELRNAIERAMLLVSEDALSVEHLPAEIQDYESSLSPEASQDRPAAEGDEKKPMSLRDEITQLEKKRILEALRRYPTQRDAAMALDMPMRTFLNRLDALGIPRARGGGSGGKQE
jgi:two-component system, NtrC family, response regulator AtoC